MPANTWFDGVEYYFDEASNGYLPLGYYGPQGDSPNPFDYDRDPSANSNPFPNPGPFPGESAPPAVAGDVAPDGGLLAQGPDAVWDDWVRRMGANFATAPSSRPKFGEEGWSHGGFGSTAATPVDQLDYSPEEGTQRYKSPFERFGRSSFGQLAGS